MKEGERKIKKKIAFAEIPAQLRQLADAIEGRASDLSSEWLDLPESITKLEVKGKARDSAWKLKVKIKAEPIANYEAQQTVRPKNTTTIPSPAAGSDEGYKQIKKRMKTTFKSIGESLAAEKLPGEAIVEAFVAASHQMMTFTAAAYGEAHYPEFRKACLTLHTACESHNLEALKTAYATLIRLKKDCHNSFK